ncbi:hypothetical protein THAOC_29086, partial [Thalassiosira oceanica]
MANTAVYSSFIYHLLFVAESGQNQHMAMALGPVIHQYRTDGQVQGIGGRRTSMRTITIRPTAGGPVVEATIETEYAAHETSGRGTCEHVQALSSLTRLAPPTPTVTEAETLDMLRSILRPRLGGKQRLKRHQVNQTSRRRVAGVTARVPLATQERFAAFLYQSDSGGQVCCGSAAVAAARSAAVSICGGFIGRGDGVSNS